MRIPTSTRTSFTIHGSTFTAAAWAGTGRHAYYIAQGDRIFVVWYIVGSAAQQPPGVTEDTLERIVASIGLT